MGILIWWAVVFIMLEAWRPNTLLRTAVNCLGFFLWLACKPDVVAREGLPDTLPRLQNVQAGNLPLLKCHESNTLGPITLIRWQDCGQWSLGKERQAV